MSEVKALGSTQQLLPKLGLLSAGGGSGIAGVAVECVEISKNTGGEGGFLDRY